MTTTRATSQKYLRAGWTAYAFAVGLTAMAGGPTAIVAVGGVAVLVVAQALLD
jgi:hypothetical protein